MSVRRLKEPVEFVEYNPEWPAIFAAERDRIVSSIGSHILDIQHVGSTSIPNMAAKPVIDMMIEVEQITHI